VGRQTLGAPTARLGAVRAEAALSLSADVNVEVLGQRIVYSLAETYTVQVALEQLSVAAAALLALEKPLLAAIEVGALPEFLLDCLLSSFALTPRASLLDVTTGRVALGAAGCQDGVGCVLQDLVTALAPVYQGGLTPRWSRPRPARVQTPPRPARAICATSRRAPWRS
jgi:hypothetical protein